MVEDLETAYPLPIFLTSFFEPLTGFRSPPALTKFSKTNHIS